MTAIRDIPATLRAIRTVLDLTQEELAERLDVSFASVNRWEGGRVRPQRASREAIAALAGQIGIGVTENSLHVDSTVIAEDAASKSRRHRSQVGQITVDTDTTAMEKMLWKAACSIRGERDAAKFKDYILPLLFLKRLSDVFDDEIARLADEYGDTVIAREIAEADHALLRFYLPPEARWSVISGREGYEWPVDGEGRNTAPRDLGEHLTKAVRAVVRENPLLSGVVDVVDFAAERNGERDVSPAKLAKVIETLSDTRYRLGLADVQPDFLGRAYEFLLRKFAEGSGRAGGEFFTPTEVAFLMAYLMRPKPGDKCHDYACGSAGLLLKLQLVARELDPTSRVPLKLTGQELQAESYATARMNAVIHDMDVEIARGDTMINPKFKTSSGGVDTHDIVVANPMWNQSFDPRMFANDPFGRFRAAGGPTSGKGDWAWLQHTLACLNDRGRAAVVLDTGAVTRGSGAEHQDKERSIRKWFVDNDLIEGVILLPDNLFYNTSAAGVIIVLARHKRPHQRRKLVLVNVSGYAKTRRPKNHIPMDIVHSLAELFHDAKPVAGIVASVSADDVAKADYNLLPTRWLDSDENEPIDLAEATSVVLKAIQVACEDAATLQGSLTGLACLNTQGRPTVQLSDLCSLVSNQVDPRDHPADDTYIGLGHLVSGRFYCSDAGKASDVRSAKSVFRTGDVLYGKLRPYLDKAILADTDGLCTTELLILRPRSAIDPRYLVGVLHAPAFVSYAVSGTTGAQHPRTSWSHIRQYRVPQLTLEEQRQIADLLWQAQRVQQTSDGLVATTGDFSRALLTATVADDTAAT